MSHYPNNLSIEEQLLQAERKFKELLNADAQFYELKQVRLEIKDLKEKLLQDQHALK